MHALPTSIDDTKRMLVDARSAGELAAKNLAAGAVVYRHHRSDGCPDTEDHGAAGIHARLGT
jgi:hypothetical protein